MHHESSPKAPQMAATESTAPNAPQPSARPGAEWRVSKEQLAAAERASLYHARQSAPTGGHAG